MPRQPPPPHADDFRFFGPDPGTPAIADDAAEAAAHSSGVVVYPIIKSRTCRACWAWTRFMSMNCGFRIAFSRAIGVISRNVMRGVVATGRLNSWHTCHAIASPSRSASVPNSTVPLHSEIACLIFRIWCIFLVIAVYLGSHLNVSLSTHMPPPPIPIPARPSDISRRWPQHATHMYEGPRYFQLFGTWWETLQSQAFCIWQAPFGLF